MSDHSVSVIIPCLSEELWQVALTRCCIETAINTTEVSFELIYAEAIGSYFINDKNRYDPSLVGVTDVLHYHNPNKGSCNGDTNAALDLATGDIVVVLTNDVFVRPGWLEAILECFDKYEDCGMAGLGTSDHQGEKKTDQIVEGVWCPIFAILNKPEFRFDAEAFPSEWGDYDLLMRIYEAGYKSYRNISVICHHLGRATNGPVSDPTEAASIEASRQRFIRRWQARPVSATLMYRSLLSGLII